jgi:putative phage-type endonuclease
MPVGRKQTERHFGMSVEVYQNRQEWLAARWGIGASEAAAAIGRSPWKSTQQLWREKVGLAEPEDISDNERVKYGTEAEEHLRRLFALDYPEYALSFTPFKIIRHDEFPFLSVTPDGELEHNGVKGGLEIKTTTIDKPGQMDEWRGGIPFNYYCQVLAAMYAAEWQFVVCKAQLKIGGSSRIITDHYLLRREECETEIAVLIEQEKEFWTMVQKRCEPPFIVELERR